MATTQSTAPQPEQSRILASSSEPQKEISTDYAAKHAATRRRGSQLIADKLFADESITPVTQKPVSKSIPVILNRQKMYDSLVITYTTWFSSRWSYFENTVQHYPLANNLTDYKSAVARAYVSQWFYDLYATLYHLSIKINGNIQRKYFPIRWSASATQYDHFLARLNATIRPTLIRLTPCTGYYFPVFAEDVNPTETNFLEINNFYIHDDLLQAVNEIMYSRQLCRFTPFSGDELGSPSWLFDFHTVGNRLQACAWFPKEGNYTDEAVELAYIVGVPCTPLQGHVDADEYQFYEDGTRPRYTIDPWSLPLSKQRHFSGSTEVRVIENDDEVPLPNFYDKTANFKLFNTGPFAISVKDNQLTPITPAAEGSTSSTTGQTTPQITEGAPQTQSTLQLVLHRDAQRGSGLSSKRSRPSEPELQTGDRFRILTYVYQATVIRRVDRGSITSSHKMFIKLD